MPGSAHCVALASLAAIALPPNLSCTHAAASGTFSPFLDINVLLKSEPSCEVSLGVPAVFHPCRRPCIVGVGDIEELPHHADEAPGHQVKRPACLGSPKDPLHLKNPCWTKNSAASPPSLLNFGPSGMRPQTYLCVRKGVPSQLLEKTNGSPQASATKEKACCLKKTPHRAFPPL